MGQLVIYKKGYQILKNNSLNQLRFSYFRTFPPSNHCIVPTSYLDKTPIYKCPYGGQNQSCVRNGGTELIEFTKATFTCNPGYHLADNETMNWACIEGSWFPELLKCNSKFVKFTPTSFMQGLPHTALYSNQKLDER